MKKVTAAICVAVFLIIYPLCSMLAACFSGKKASCDTQSGVSVLEQLEAVSADEAQKNVDAVFQKRQEAADAEREKNLLAQSLKDVRSGKKSYRKVFSNVYFMGDSLMNGLEVYGILNPNRLMTQVSASLYHLEENMDKIVSVKPPVLILHYGLNMISTDSAQLNSFIKKYGTLISTLKKKLPKTRIIVSLIFPVDTTKAGAARFKYVGKYNKALIEMCKQKEVEYLNSTSVVKENAEYRASDGIHFAKSFYYAWLQFIMKDKGIY